MCIKGIVNISASYKQTYRKCEVFVSVCEVPIA